MTKQDILKALQSLPDDADYMDFIDRLVFLYKIERGIAQIEAGQGGSHEEAKARFAKWLAVGDASGVEGPQ